MIYPLYPHEDPVITTELAIMMIGLRHRPLRGQGISAKFCAQIISQLHLRFAGGDGQLLHIKIYDIISYI